MAAVITFSYSISTPIAAIYSVFVMASAICKQSDGRCVATLIEIILPNPSFSLKSRRLVWASTCRNAMCVILCADPFTHWWWCVRLVSGNRISNWISLTGTGCHIIISNTATGTCTWVNTSWGWLKSYIWLEWNNI